MSDNPRERVDPGPIARLMITVAGMLPILALAAAFGLFVKGLL